MTAFYLFGAMLARYVPRYRRWYAIDAMRPLTASERLERRWAATLTRERAEHAALRETARDAVRQAHGFMHYGSLEECGAGICIKRRAALDEVKG